MNIKAKLFVCGEERELLSSSLNYNRLTDWNGKPTSALMGGVLQLPMNHKCMMTPLLNGL
ncbi:type VI secretion system tube protein TssD [Tenacibaculum sp. SDUM215027]|uniref:type VI secretion system tube protein TssD n=1 Tax=Tenacibaculum sp. SDUM215027 TaxID=3422596 RepID=UPI003D3168A4